MRIAPAKDKWKPVFRPGYFGRRRDEKIAKLNETYGEGDWSLRWCVPAFPDGLEFNDACILFYEASYIAWFNQHPDELYNVIQYGECIDNAITNTESGTDYSVQESFSTHIQDIAVRNVLQMNGVWFEGSRDNILVIRSSDSNGHKYGPGNIPFINPELIEQPFLTPRWARENSVESFWQSNKYVFVRD